MVHKILALIDPNLMDPSDEGRAFKYIAPEQPADTSDAVKLEACRGAGREVGGAADGRRRGRRGHLGPR